MISLYCLDSETMRWVPVALSSLPKRQAVSSAAAINAARSRFIGSECLAQRHVGEESGRVGAGQVDVGRRAGIARVQERHRIVGAAADVLRAAGHVQVELLGQLAPITYLG